MNFLIIANSLFTISKFRMDLIKALQNKGYTVHVVAPEFEDPVIADLQSKNVVYHPIAMSRAGLNPVQDLRLFWQLYKLINQVKPDKVLAYTIKPIIYGSLAGWLSKTKGRYSLVAGLGYAFTEAEERSFRRGLTNFVARFLYSLSLNRCHNVFFQNPDDQALFKELGVLKQSTATEVVNGSGVNLARFAPAPIPDKPTFVLISRLLYDKGVKIYAQAAQKLKAKYPQAEFNLVGFLDVNPQSVTQEELDSWIAGGYINFLGRLEDVRPALLDAGVFVLPSFYREGVPRSILEALAMGRAIVTTDSPGCRETVRETAIGKNGFLVQPQSVDSLAAAMEQLILNPEMNKRMGEASLLLAQEVFDVHKVNEQMLKGMKVI